MKEAVQTEFEDDKQRCYAQNVYSKPGSRQRTFGRLHSLDSSSDRIYDQTFGKVTPSYMPTETHFSSQTNSRILQYLGTQSSDLQARTKTSVNHNASPNSQNRENMVQNRLNRPFNREDKLKYNHMYNRSNSAEEFRGGYTLLREVPPSLNGYSVLKSEYKMSSPDQLSGLVQIHFFQLDCLQSGPVQI